MKCIHCGKETDEGALYQTSDAWIKRNKKIGMPSRIKRKQGYICNHSVVQLAAEQDKRAANIMTVVVIMAIFLLLFGFLSDRTSIYHKLIVIFAVAGVFVGVVMAFQLSNVRREMNTFLSVLGRNNPQEIKELVETGLNYEHSLTAQTAINRFLDTSNDAELLPGEKK